MFKSGRIVAATLGLTVFFAGLWFSWVEFSAYQQRQADERATAAQYYSDATQNGPRACRPIVEETGLFDWLTCLADNVSADGSIKQSEYDLKAQQEMAAMAFGMLIATVWLTAITLLGVFFVWRTLKATQDMARDTRDIGEAQTTSYLNMEYVDTRPLEIGVWTDFAVRNAGKTPSFNTEARIRIRPYNVLFPDTMDPYSGEKVALFQCLEPGSLRTRTVVFGRGIDDVFLDMAAQHGAETYSAEVVLTWEDVFGRKHRGIFKMSDPVDIPGEQGKRKNARRMLTASCEFTRE